MINVTECHNCAKKITDEEVHKCYHGVWPVAKNPLSWCADCCADTDKYKFLCETCGRERDGVMDMHGEDPDARRWDE